MENKMKKLIALFATTAVASGSAMGAIALSGTASVSYDDNGSAASATTYDADFTLIVVLLVQLLTLLNGY
jgi:P pilus assembly chaperone PapD